MQTLRLCVLASSSSGNCSVLAMDTPRGLRMLLIDAGLTPRRTECLLAGLGLDLSMIDGVVLTHLDQDHWQPTWGSRLPGSSRLWIHRRHRRRAERDCPAGRCIELFGDEAPFEAMPGVIASSCLLSHDETGVACLKFSTSTSALGYATDVGSPSQAMLDHLRGVGTLAIESNYCPTLQVASDRPAFLINRIMGGGGHLSNHQSAQVVRDLGHTGDVVLLHLSKQCNSPERALSAHAPEASRTPVPRVIVASPDAPTDWIPVASASAVAAATERPQPVRERQRTLFS